MYYEVQAEGHVTDRTVTGHVHFMPHHTHTSMDYFHITAQSVKCYSFHVKEYDLLLRLDYIQPIPPLILQ